ncbi:MAG: TMEM175 family protein [Lachnospiraceae bacterium]|jgi:uncharacterized membrane protein|nr:TMEM175 family protein [Lachnospiraceae bacterium]
MSKSRLEAFTDGVLAIIITIFVLDLGSPENGTIKALMRLDYHFFIYFLSFLTVAIYWINHHHLLQITNTISGSVLWLNIFLLLFLSLFPFATSWVSDNPRDMAPEMFYAGIMLVADVVWLFLAKALIKENGSNSRIAMALDGSRKSQITIVAIVLGIIIGIFLPYAPIIGCIISLLPWFIPDKKIEQYVKEISEEEKTSAERIKELRKIIHEELEEKDKNPGD